MDLSPAFQKGADAYLPKAQVTFDRFHLMKRVNEAVDHVHRSEALTRPDLKKTRWVWLKNDRNLKAKLQESLQNLKTEQAYQYRLAFQDIYTIKNRHQSAPLLKAWLESAKSSGLTPIVKVAYTIMNHWDSALRWSESQINNGIFEGFNSLIQSAKAKARGYRTHKNFISMAYRSWVNWILGYPLKMSINQLSPSIKE
ncbi:transposase [Acidithiobacillus thiooxidans ATCC 19377]|jgi:transposase|uniref:Transposase n=1 Tax=Acidithiobacillus thiooxidans ATCC 19377 TaxID=637390 RepID=A0A5P9XTA5_ACITH|nr:transposase [Acidithiobacillus thiooxidans ATCC 19377]